MMSKNDTRIILEDQKNDFLYKKIILIMNYQQYKQIQLSELHLKFVK